MSSSKITGFDLDPAAGFATEEFVTDLVTQTENFCVNMIQESLKLLQTETWTFVMSDGSIVTKEVVIGL